MADTLLTTMRPAAQVQEQVGSDALQTPPTPAIGQAGPLNAGGLVSSPNVGFISFLVFGVRVKVVNTGGDWGQTNSQVQWSSSSGFSIVTLPSPFLSDGLFHDYRTGSIPACPGGGPWDWAEVNSISLTGVVAHSFTDDEPVGPGSWDLFLGDGVECTFVEVWGVSLTKPGKRLGPYFRHEILQRTGVAFPEPK